MKPFKQCVHEVFSRSFAPYRNLPQKQVEDAGQSVLDRLRRQPQWTPAEPPTLRRVAANWKLRWSAVAGSALIVGIVVLVPSKVFESSPAVLEDAAGARSIAFGEVVGTNGGTLKLYDGSRVELRPESEVSLERGENEIRLRLRKGDVIVNAAEKPEVKLQVETQDLSAAGKVFLVSTGEKGTHVAVIGGEARVVEGTSEKRLLPGEQVSTTPTMEVQAVGHEISWSPTALAHVALLQQSVLPTAVEKVEFEVASVRLNTSGSTLSRLEDQAERVLISNATLERIIRYAFNDRNTKMSGPALLNSRRYDIEARAPSGTPKSQLLPMLQALLMDRFKMKSHRETVEMPIYALMIGKDGHKLEEIKPGEQISGFGTGSGSTPGLSTTLSMGDMKNFAANLSSKLDRPVVDKTGLAGRFNIKLAYVRDGVLATDGVTGPSLFVALQEQLGLKLEPQRGPIEIFVIDELQEPSPN